MNGYEDFASVPNEKKDRLLDPGYAWGVFIADSTLGGEAVVPGTGLKQIVIVVKWTDTSRNRQRYTLLETFVSQVAPRM